MTNTSDLVRAWILGYDIFYKSTSEKDRTKLILDYLEEIRKEFLDKIDGIDKIKLDWTRDNEPKWREFDAGYIKGLEDAKSILL